MVQAFVLPALIGCGIGAQDMFKSQIDLRVKLPDTQSRDSSMNTFLCLCLVYHCLYRESDEVKGSIFVLCTYSRLF